ncbi:MAG: helix-turn-helix domain-containing protein [Bacteroidales bacterium]
MIDKFVKNTSREISIDYIQKVVCDYFGLPLEAINSKTRKREIVQARQSGNVFFEETYQSVIGYYWPALWKQGPCNCVARLSDG